MPSVPREYYMHYFILLYFNALMIPKVHIPRVEESAWGSGTGRLNGCLPFQIEA